MYLVTNNKNFHALDTLAQQLIEPLLEIFIDAKKNACGIRTSNTFFCLPVATKTVVNMALTRTAVGKKGKKPKLSLDTFCENLILNTSLSDLEGALDLYRVQNKLLKSYNYSFSSSSVAPEIHKLFVDVFYGKLFDNSMIWKALKLTTLSREQFHSNFKAENRHTESRCPYCDLDTIVSSGTHVVEHFLPKATFPLLAMSARNLFTACYGCNSPSGKGKLVVPVVTSPYAMVIGDEVDFSFSVDTISVTAKPSADKGVTGFLTLVKIPQRYAKPDVWRAFWGRRRAILDSLANRNNFPSDLNAHIDIQQGSVPLTFALKYWFINSFNPAAAILPAYGNLMSHLP